MKNMFSRLAGAMMAAALIISMSCTAHAASGSITIRRVTGDAQRNCAIFIDGVEQSAGDVYVQSFPVTIEIAPNAGYFIWAVYRDGKLISDPNTHDKEGSIELRMDQPSSNVNVAVIVYAAGAPTLKNTPASYDERYSYGASGSSQTAPEQTSPNNPEPEQPGHDEPVTTEPPSTQPAAPVEDTPAHEEHPISAEPSTPTEPSVPATDATTQEDHPTEDTMKAPSPVQPGASESPNEPAVPDEAENTERKQEDDTLPGTDTQPSDKSKPSDIEGDIQDGGVGGYSENTEREFEGGVNILHLVLILGGAAMIATAGVIFIFKRKVNKS